MIRQVLPSSVHIFDGVGGTGFESKAIDFAIVVKQSADRTIDVKITCFCLGRRCHPGPPVSRGGPTGLAERAAGLCPYYFSSDIF